MKFDGMILLVDIWCHDVLIGVSIFLIHANGYEYIIINWSKNIVCKEMFCNCSDSEHEKYDNLDDICWKISLNIWILMLYCN